MGEPEVDAVVVGAGIAGLSAALELQDAGWEVAVVDPSDRPGGVMRTDHAGGYVFERGPNTMHLAAPAFDFLKRHNVDKALLRARSISSARFVYRGGQLVPVPMSPPALLRTPLLRARGKFRVLAEPIIRRGAGESESVAEFIGRRLGREVVSGLVSPFLAGIYAGDEDELGARAVFGKWVEYERRFGSIAIGALLSKFGGRKPRGPRGIFSTEQGLGPYARSLAGRLREPPALGSRVARIVQDGARWRVDVAGPSGDQALSAHRVVVAAPAFDAAEILREVDFGVAEALGAIEYAPLVTVPLGIDPAESAVRIEGFGFLVSREEALGLLGCLFMSRLFPSRAPEGRELLHCMVGGTRWPEAIDEPEDRLIERLASDLERTMGIRYAPDPLAITRWSRAVPQPGRDHVARIAWVREQLRETPGLVLAGGYLDGVGVSASLVSGISAAAELLALPR